jgi:serine/threonine protein kinase
MADNQINIVLEYIEQGSLVAVIKQFGSMSESLAASYMCQILHGLSYLHDAGVIHCDIKCANILSTKLGELKLTDFGVSHTSRKTMGKGQEEVAGSPYWMAPEVVEFQGITTAADIWSLGCTLLELMTGQPPNHEMPALSAMYRIASGPPPAIPAGFSPQLKDFLSKCFVKDPKQRATAKQLLAHEFLKNRRSQVVPAAELDAAAAAKEVPAGGRFRARSSSNAQKNKDAVMMMAKPVAPSSELIFASTDPIVQKLKSAANPTTLVDDVFKAFAPSGKMSVADAPHALRCFQLMLSDKDAAKLLQSCTSHQWHDCFNCLL